MHLFFYIMFSFHWFIWLKFANISECFNFGHKLKLNIFKNVQKHIDTKNQNQTHRFHYANYAVWCQYGSLSRWRGSISFKAMIVATYDWRTAATKRWRGNHVISWSISSGWNLNLLTNRTSVGLTFGCITLNESDFLLWFSISQPLQLELFTISYSL